MNKWINLLFVWVSVHCHYAEDVCDILNRLSKEEVDSAKIIKLPNSPVGYTLFYNNMDWDGSSKEFDLKEQK